MKYIILTTFLLLGCGSNSTTPTSTPINNNENGSQPSTIIDNNTSQTPRETIRADIIKVEVTGTTGNYMFRVSVKSNDTGLEQYADWWEVLDVNKELIYKRMIGHPHIGEQPFTRYAEHAIDIQSDDIIYIRAHMNNKGYVGDVFKGSVESGFNVVNTVPAI